MFAKIGNGAPQGGSTNRSKDSTGRMLAEVVGVALGIDPDRLTRTERGDARTAFARHVAIYLACTRLGLSFTEAGRLFGRDRTTASYACRRVEERRDEAWTDQLVDRLGGAIDPRTVQAVPMDCAA